MKKYLPILFLIFGSIIAIWAIIQLNPKVTTPIDEGKIQVFSSIIPIANLIEKVGGDFVQSEAIVPVGASVHTYEPTPSQLRAISTADIFMKVGTPIEFEVVWLDKLLGVNNQLLLVDLSKGIELREFEDDHEENEHEDEHGDDHESEEEHGHEGVDPHIWLSPENTIVLLETITMALIEEMPEETEFFLANKNKLLQDLEEKSKRIQASLENFSNKEIIVYHDAWGYFARDYALNLVVVEENQKEPTAKRLQEVITIAKEKNITAIFASPEFNTQSAETIAKEVGAEVLFISPLPEDLFIAFEDIANAFAQTLNK